MVSLFNSGIPFACLSFALLSRRTGLWATLNATVPMFGAVVAWFWRKDRPTGSRALGVLCTGIAYILYFRLIATAGPARALAVTFVVPVFAVYYGVMFLSEAVTPWMLLCGAVIVCGTALSTSLLKIGR